MLQLCACCRLPLVQGSRVWRHGIPSFIALNWDFPANEHPDYVSSHRQVTEVLQQDALDPDLTLKKASCFCIVLKLAVLCKHRA